MSPGLADLLFAVTVVLYLVASGLFLGYLGGVGAASRPRASIPDGPLVAAPPPGPPRIAPHLLAVGAVFHGAHIVVSSLVLHVCPVEGMHFAMSVLSMFACLVYVVLRRRYRIDVLGAFVAPLALTFLLASRIVAVQREPTRLRGAILPLHVTVNLLGIGLFTLAFAAATLYLVQEKQLKKKALGGVFQRLPPLDALDKAEHRFLVLGFPLLTIGILTGTLWAPRIEAGSAADIARAAFGYATWLLFAVVLLLRAAAGWRGRRAAYGTIAGFGFAVLVLLLYLWRSVSPASAPPLVAFL